MGGGLREEVRITAQRPLIRRFIVLALFVCDVLVEAHFTDLQVASIVFAYQRQAYPYCTAFHTSGGLRVSLLSELCMSL